MKYKRIPIEWDLKRRFPLKKKGNEEIKCNK